jgi:hypothetical protein
MYFVHIGLDQPAEYTIRFQGRLSGDSSCDEMSDWFLGEPRCFIETGAGGEMVTVLTGTLADQSALHGLLVHIRDLGLILLLVDCLTGRGVRSV